MAPYKVTTEVESQEEVFALIETLVKARYSAVECDNCNAVRGPNDTDYNPLALIMGTPSNPGWYSADDGEFCGECMEHLFRVGNNL